MALEPKPMPGFPRLDPYLSWRLLDQNLGALAEPGSEAAYYSVVLHLRRPFEPVFGPGYEESNDHVAPSHVHCLAEGRRRTTIVPALVTLEGLLALIEQSLTGVGLGTNVERWELSLPRSEANVVPPLLTPADANPPHSPAGPAATVAKASNFRAFARWTAQVQGRGKNGASPSYKGAQRPTARQCEPEVCVIDDRCNFASTALAIGSESKVNELFVLGANEDQLERLDRTARYGPPWTIEGPFPYSFNVSGCLQGRRLGTAQFSPSQVGRGPASGPALDDEPSVYRACAYMHPTPSASHGSAVVSLIASDRLRIGTKAFDRPGPKKVRFAQLPVETVLDTSGGSLAAHVLDAIHDALERLTPHTDLVVNLSFGTHGGGHDGTSMLESALAELLDIYNGHSDVDGKRLIVVLPAGNSQRVRCHARGSNRPGTAGIIDWKVQPDSGSHDFMEIWIPKGKAFEVRIDGPGGAMVGQIKVGAGTRSAVCTLIRNGTQLGAAIYSASPPQSELQSLLLIGLTRDLPRNPGIGSLANFNLARFLDALGGDQAARLGRVPGKKQPSGQAMAHGVWRISIVPDGASGELDWHAFVQRGDHAPHRRRAAAGVPGRQSYIVDGDGSEAVPEFTLNGIATFTHERLFVVGALHRNDGSLIDYSAAGPTTVGCHRTDGPDVVVAADESRRWRGLLVNGVLGGGHRRESGTSMAAATLTRHLWEHLDAGGAIESFCGPAPEEESLGFPSPAGSPRMAHPILRGETRRMVSTREDGSLVGEPCSPSAGPAFMCPPRQSAEPSRR